MRCDCVWTAMSLTWGRGYSQLHRVEGFRSRVSCRRPDTGFMLDKSRAASLAGGKISTSSVTGVAEKRPSTNRLDSGWMGWLHAGAAQLVRGGGPAAGAGAGQGCYSGLGCWVPGIRRLSQARGSLPAPPETSAAWPRPATSPGRSGSGQQAAAAHPLPLCRRLR